MRKIFNKVKDGPGIYVIKCPYCRTILAGASEYDLLPEFMLCDCDEGKQTKSLLI